MRLWPQIRVPVCCSLLVWALCLGYVASAHAAPDRTGSTAAKADHKGESHFSRSVQRRSPVARASSWDGDNCWNWTTDGATPENSNNVSNLAYGIRSLCVATRAGGGTWTHLQRITGQSANVGTGKSLADLHTLLTTTNGYVDNLEADITALRADLKPSAANCTVAITENSVACRVRVVEGYVDAVEGKLDTIDGRVDNVEAKLDTLHDDLVAVVDAIEAQGPNPAYGEDANPMRVAYASSESQVEEAANAATSGLWFLAGLLVVASCAYALTRAVMPR